MKVALVYDRVNKWGGAERVLLALHQIFPDAPLYTAVYDSRQASWAKVFPKIISSRIKLPHELIPFLMPVIFESFNFGDYDLVISVTSEYAKGIIVRPPTKHICYCLTPTRYLWSGYNEYFKDQVFKGVTKPIVSYLREWDKIAAQRPDRIIAISTAVQERIKKYYNRESEIIFPPAGRAGIRNSKLEIRKHYLLVSRLVPYKKVDLAIRAFNNLGYKLVIVGTGSEVGKLKRMAGNNIIFTGFITDEKLINYYQKAKALIFPQEEDFGLVAIEAQSYGVPVIAYRGGGSLDTVIEGKTGIYFDKQNMDSLILAIRKFEKLNFRKEDIIRNVRQYGQEIFERNIRKVICQV